MVEACLLKIEHLGYDVNSVTSAGGSAPIAPVIGDDNLMMGITNDMIIYGARVFLRAGTEIDIEKVPSSSSPAHGRPFAEIFKDAGYDFYKIGPEIFAPAEVSIENTQTKEIKKAGNTNPEIIKKATGK
jgi:methenyltetrahydromethanopterin cyclohydrolase